MYFEYILTIWPHLTPIWPLVTSERSWYRHFRNQQKKCYRLICISPTLKCVSESNNMYFGYNLTNWPHLTPIWPLVTSERSWYRHFRNQQKICFPNVCISPRLNSVFFKIPISVDIGSFDVDLTPKRSKFDQTKGRNEILITFSYNIRVQNGDSLWVIFQASALLMDWTLPRN